MPAPFWGNIALEESLKRAQIRSLSEQQKSRAAALTEQIRGREVQMEQFATQQKRLEAQAAAQLQQYQMQYGVEWGKLDIEQQRVGLETRAMSLDERKQLWVEYEKANLPTFEKMGNTLVATYPDGSAIEAWKAPPEPIVMGMDQSLVTPTGEVLYAPPKIIVTSPTQYAAGEIHVIDRADGSVMNRIPLENIPPDANIEMDKYGNTTVVDKKSGELIKYIPNPMAEELMKREAKDAEKDRQLEGRLVVVEEEKVRIEYLKEGRAGEELKIKQDAQTLKRDYFELAATTEQRAWEQMFISKDLAMQAGLREEVATQLNAAIEREGLVVTATGYQLSASAAAAMNLTAQEKIRVDALLTSRALDVQEMLGIDKLELDRILGTGKLVVEQQAETRLLEQMYINENIATRAQLSVDKWKEVNTILTSEGYDLQKYLQGETDAVKWRIAAMTNLTEREKTMIMADLEDRKIRILSGRVEAEIEAGKFVVMGDVMVKRNEDGTMEIAFEMSQSNYGLTPIKVGDDKSGYSVAMIDPYKGTVDVLAVLPGGAEGEADAKRYLELLDMARKIVDPGNTFLTAIDPDVKNEIYRQTMALYGDLLMAPRPAGMGLTPEQASKFTTPRMLWGAQDIRLTFGGVLPEPTALLFEKYLQKQPYGEAVVAPLEVTTPTPTPTTKVKELEVVEAKKPKAAQEWIDEFKGVRSGEIAALQRFMIDEGFWEGEADGRWSNKLERKFRMEFRKGNIDIKETGG